MLILFRNQYHIFPDIFSPERVDGFLTRFVLTNYFPKPISSYGNIFHSILKLYQLANVWKNVELYNISVFMTPKHKVNFWQLNVAISLSFCNFLFGSLPMWQKGWKIKFLTRAGQSFLPLSMVQQYQKTFSYFRFLKLFQSSSLAPLYFSFQVNTFVKWKPLETQYIKLIISTCQVSLNTL